MYALHLSGAAADDLHLDRGAACVPGVRIGKAIPVQGGAAGSCGVCHQRTDNHIFHQGKKSRTAAGGRCAGRHALALPESEGCASAESASGN